MSRVAAVVINYNGGAYLLECVRSLRADGVAHVVVVDNRSSDGSADALARNDADAMLVSTGANLGFGAAANRGVLAVSAFGHAAGGPVDYVLILNPDTVVEPGTVKALAEVLDQRPEVAIVAPRLENPDGSVYPSARRFPDLVVAAGHAFLGLVHPRNRFTRAYKMLDWDHSRPADVDWVSGACLLARREAFSDLGGFDERYFMYAEDVDLCWRAWQSGWKVAYEPRGRVVHTVGVSTDQAPYRMIAAHHRSLWRYATKTTAGGRRALLPLVALGLAVRTALAWAHRAAGRPIQR